MAQQFNQMASISHPGRFVYGLIAAAIMLHVALALQICSTAKAGNKEIAALAARLGGDAKKTRFVTDFSKSVDYSIKVLSNPFRVIVDLPEVEFQFPPGLGRFGRGLVKEYRYGQFGEGKSRIVLDVKSPVLVAKSFVISARNNQPARFVLDLVKTDLATFAKAKAVKKRKSKPDIDQAAQIATVLQRMIASSPTPQANKYRKSTDKPRAKPKKKAAARPILPPSSRKKSGGKRIIVIDPGHGGVDPGALGRRGTAEKSVTLAFSRKLRDELKKSSRYEVYLTRDSDRFIRLKDRVKFAREKRAHLFISIHADSIKRGRASGATLYTLSEKASDKEAGELAAQENRADIIAGVALQSESNAVTGILIDLAQRETKNHSIFLAKQVVNWIKGVTRVRKKSLRQAGFRVLKAPDVPSVLIELGFLSSRRDEANLRSKAWRAKVAVAVKSAINRYFATKLANRF